MSELEITYDQTPLRLTAEEYEQLRGILESNSWKLLLKIWQADLNAMTRQALSADRNNWQFRQGFVKGLIEAADCIRRVAGTAAVAEGNMDPDTAFALNQSRQSKRVAAYPS